MFIAKETGDQQIRYNRGENHSDRVGAYIAMLAIPIVLAVVVSYVVIGHAREIRKTEKEIGELERTLQRLKRSQGIRDSLDEVYMQQEVSDEISRREMCHPAYPLLGRGKRPGPFLQLSGENLRLIENEKTHLKSITGWKIDGTGGCTEFDPIMEGPSITIKKEGYYFVYTSLSINSIDSDKPTVMKHGVQFMRVFANVVRLPPFLISENAHQISGHSLKRTSYQNVVVKLSEGDILQVVLQLSDSSLEFGYENSFGIVGV